MAVTTRGGKQIIDPPIPSGVEDEVRKENDVVEDNGELVEKAVKEAEIPQKVIPLPRPPPPFPQRLFMNDIVTKKRSVSFEDYHRMQHCNTIGTRSLVQKEEDPRTFTIPCTIYLLHFTIALCDLGASKNLMLLSIYKKLGLGDPKPTMMKLPISDRTMKRPIEILHDVLVKVESFIFSANFVIFDCEVDFDVLIILGSPFLSTNHGLVDMEKRADEVYVKLMKNQLSAFVGS
nr:uncharacterized protein LOC101259684 [Solanum lycopersicum]